jgi:hypothetical protein
MRLPGLFLSVATFPLLATFAGCGGNVSAPAGSGPSTGCSAGPGLGQPGPCPTRVASAGVSFNGKVLAGLQPVIGASVQLYAAGIAGNGSTPTALLGTALTADSTGSFTVPAGYSCPSAQTPIYLLSKGGKPATASAANASLWLMTALGPCGGVGAGTTVVVNEATTIASAWALAPFLSSGGNVGASCTNTAGLDNAFLTANNLVNANTGSSPGAMLPSTLKVATAKLNTLANALSACAVSGGNACSTLFSAAINNGVLPGNTLDAALNIAHAPSNNVASVYAVATGSSVFSPTLSTAPPDWMLYSTISGGGMSLPSSVSITANGEVWVSSYLDAVSEFMPSGAAVFPTGISGYGINQSYGMALDIQGNVWIANEQTTSNSGLGNITELNASGQLLASGVTSGGIYFPVAATADSNGNIWIVDYGDSKVTLLSSSGSPLSGANGWGGSSLEFPVALAVDSNHNAWVANQAGQLPVTKVSADGSQITNYSCNCDGASGIATDQNNNVWIANYNGDSISEVNNCGTTLLAGVKGGGVLHPQGIAVDGAGAVWVANYRGNSVSEIAGSFSSSPGTFLSPSIGLGTDAGLFDPYGLAIDGSGSIWVTNSANNTLTQFIGVATPVKTPLAGPPQIP